MTKPAVAARTVHERRPAPILEPCTPQQTDLIGIQVVAVNKDQRLVECTELLQVSNRGNTRDREAADVEAQVLEEPSVLAATGLQELRLERVLRHMHR